MNVSQHSNVPIHMRKHIVYIKLLYEYKEKDESFQLIKLIVVERQAGAALPFLTFLEVLILSYSTLGAWQCDLESMGRWPRP